MKRPWDVAGRGHDDMEALQTDVMRFMAILGLCLAAIFSLVRSPDFNPPAELTVAKPDVSVPTPSAVIPVREIEEPAEAPVNESESSAPLAQSEDADRPVVPEEEGFILEFESAKSLGSLVTSGTVTLVVADRNTYWSWSNEKGLDEVSDLSGFYVMEERTVPGEYRMAAEARLGHGDRTWGVVLPAAIITQIDSLVERHSGGALVISSTGGVSLDTSP